MDVFIGSVYVGRYMHVGVSVRIGSVYVGICMWVQAYLDGCECAHR